MPLSIYDRINNIISRLALAGSIVIALSVPAGYGVIVFKDIADSLEFKAKVKASALSGMIGNIPDTWMFAENRLQGIIAREPVILNDEMVIVRDMTNSVITKAGVKPDGFTLERSFPLFDSGEKVGTVSVIGSAAPAIQSILISSILSALLAIAVFVIVKKIPLRALRSVTDALHDQMELAEKTLSSINDAVILTDPDCQVLHMNSAAETLLELCSADVVGTSIHDHLNLRGEESGNPLRSTIQSAIENKKVTISLEEEELVTSSGKVMAIEERSSPIFDRDGKLSGAVLVLRDVSAVRKFLKLRSWEASHDLLTGLLNRREFEKRLQLVLDEAKTSKRTSVLCFMDLDRFKIVNDTSGHAAGDELLIQISRLILARVRDVDVLARLGGDEFGLILDGCEESQALRIANEIISAVGDFRMTWESKIHGVGISVGVTLISAGHASVNEILGEADSACYWAKEQGKNQAVVFVPTNMTLMARRTESGWVAKINQALVDNQFELYFQSYRSLNAAATHPSHIEILLRMLDDNGVVVRPGKFLPAAERYNLSFQIDRWVIHEVFSRHAELVEQNGGLAMICAINLSGASIGVEELADYIIGEADKYGVEPAGICFELSEAVAINKYQAAVQFMEKMKTRGFLLALDDFGASISSFKYLKTLPVDYLKIDGRFVANVESDRLDLAMVETFNQVGHLLGKLTVAEFSESEAIIVKLGMLGVDFAQGYSVGEPAPLFPRRSLDSP